MQSQPLPEQYSSYVHTWEHNTINDIALNMLISLQHGNRIHDTMLSMGVMIRELLWMATPIQETFLKAKYGSIERAIFFLLYHGARQLNVNMEYFQEGPPPMRIAKPVTRTTDDFIQRPSGGLYNTPMGGMAALEQTHDNVR